MNKLNITTGEVIITERDGRFTFDNQAIDVWFGLSQPESSKAEAKANVDLIADAFKVAIEHHYTPTMLLEEVQRLTDFIRETHELMAEVLRLDTTLDDIMKERKEAAKLLLKSKQLMERSNEDPLYKDQNKKTAFFRHIEKIGEFIEKTK